MIWGIILATIVKGVLILARFIFLLHSSDHDCRIDDMFQRSATLEHTCIVLAALVRLGTLIELLRTVLKQNTLDYVFSRSVLYRPTRFSAYSYKPVHAKALSFLPAQLGLSPILRWIGCTARRNVLRGQFGSLHLFSAVTSTSCFFSSVSGRSRRSSGCEQFFFSTAAMTTSRQNYQ